MKIWLFFFDPLDCGSPEANECIRICEEAKKKGVETEVLNPDHIELLVDSSGDWSANYEGRLLDLPDVIVPRTGAETSYTAYSVMRFYERLGVTFLNTPRVIETVADKLHTTQVLAANGFPVPRTMLGTFPPNMESIEKNLGFPLIVKTLLGMCGGGVFLAETKDQFKDLTDLIAEANSNAHFLFQKYISRSRGRDLRVFIVGGKILAVMERIATNGSFKANISKGAKGVAHPLTPEIAELSMKVARELRLDLTGIDLLFDEDGFVICEANSTPGFTGLDVACDVNGAKAIVEAAISKHNASKRSLWSPIGLFDWVTGRRWPSSAPKPHKPPRIKHGTAGTLKKTVVQPNPETPPVIETSIDVPARAEAQENKPKEIAL